MGNGDGTGAEEPKARLDRLKSRYDDLQETITFNLTHSSAHIGAGEVRQDQETLNELRDEIAALERQLAEDSPERS